MTVYDVHHYSVGGGARAVGDQRVIIRPASTHSGESHFIKVTYIAVRIRGKWTWRKLDEQEK